MTGFIGFAYEADKQFEREYRLSRTKNSIAIEYDETVQRISTEIDISECIDNASIHRIKHAVWDTGATSSSISEKIAREIGLRPVDKGIIVTATDQKEMPIYLVDVQLADGITIRNLKIFGNPMINRDVDFLIGMDIISKGDFSISNREGKTKVSFSFFEA